MRKLLAIALTLATGMAFAGDHYVQGYYKKDGTYVAGHMQTDPNSSLYDNYSTRGNVNPYTGQPGTVNPYRVEPPRMRTYEPPQIKPIQPLQPLQPLQPWQPQ